jgi:hypothetical protein
MFCLVCGSENFDLREAENRVEFSEAGKRLKEDRIVNGYKYSLQLDSKNAVF